MKTSVCRVLLCVACWMAGTAIGSAQVKVTKAAGDKMSIDLAGFTAEGGEASVFRSTLQSDLLRSGWFRVVSRGAEVSLSGSAEDRGGQLVVSCQIREAGSGASRFGKRYRAQRGQARTLAHRVAEEIVRELVGKPTFLTSRLALVGNASGAKELYLCDSDGHGLVQVTSDKSVSLSPHWSPDGQRLAYTSYIKRFPDVFMIELSSGKRTLLSGYSGLNTGGAFSPDGRSVALILSKDGNPDLYVKDLGSGQLTRLTSTKMAAEASPSWSPDGRRIVYVSDQSGSPQLYVISRSGGAAQRLTSRGSQNVSPDWGENGWIAYSSLIGGKFQVCIIDPNTREVRQITSGPDDFEDPSWAPGGRHLAASRTRAYRSSLYLLDTMGDAPIALLEQSGGWFSPAWSPRK